MKKFNLLIILFLTCFPFIGLTQSQQLLNLKKLNVVTSIIYMNKGEEMKYHVTETKTKYKNEKEKPEYTQKTEYDLSLKITDSTEHTYDFEMKYSGFKTDSRKNEAEDAMAKIMEGMVVKYQTDEFGVFDTITNLEELSVTFEKAIDLISEKYLGLIKDEEQKTMMKNKMAMLKIILSMPENLEINFSQDIIYIHSMYGTEMILNKPETYEIEFPVLQNLSFMGTATIQLKSIDKNRNECLFETNEKPNRDEINKFLDQILLEFFPEVNDKDKKKAISDLKFTSSVRIGYTMELSSGKMKKIKSKSSSKVVNGKKSSKTISEKEYKLL